MKHKVIQINCMNWFYNNYECLLPNSNFDTIYSIKFECFKDLLTLNEGLTSDKNIEDRLISLAYLYCIRELKINEVLKLNTPNRILLDLDLVSDYNESEVIQEIIDKNQLIFSNQLYDNYRVIAKYYYNLKLRGIL